MSQDIPPYQIPPIEDQASPTISPVPPGAPPLRPSHAQPSRRRRGAGSWILLIFGVMALLGSIFLNVILMAMVASDADISFSKGTLRGGKKSQTVAVYDITGGIYAEAVMRFSRFHDKIRDDSNVKAVVLRVNSGGGGLSASDQIHRMVKELSDMGKIVVVSMGGVAASGAYYISAPADEIIAERTTITGSIGVVATWLVLKGTLEKIGVEPVIVKSTNARGWKDEMSPFRKPGEREIAHIREILDEFQGHFEQVVRQGRKGRLKTRKRTYTLPTSQGSRTVMVRHSETEPFNGKIYLADEAISLGLIDRIGYESDAIDRACELAGLDRPRVVQYTHKKGLMARMLESRTMPLLSLDAKGLHGLRTPQILLLWRMP
ncbi:MAG: S49 family peptidase [Phycisphaerae bacterium]|nr:S49 family peptidase [Phycisphaerae bacterium]